MRYMNKFKVDLKNCYGIQDLKHELNFFTSKSKTYAIYAPNGLMKTSFSKTFENPAKGQNPREKRYNRQSTCMVEADGTKITKEMICVLKSEIDNSSDSSAITDQSG